MGNCKKYDRKRPELDINELFKRFKLESKQIQKTFKDIEGSLKRSQELMQRLLTTRTRNNVLPNENAFFNVADAPAVPTPTPTTPTPVPQVQVTITQQTLINNVLSTARNIGRVRRQIINTIEAIIGGAVLTQRVLQQQRIGEISANRAILEIEEIGLGLLILLSDLESLREELEELRENLDINIGLLANTVL
ncbi:hypothetical protein [Priestia megaterium]|uniref:hypothetical protein n=1 Tax=Priestia megaterium TaxID=1404 RepID=UPI00077D8454|nr:hypothetical protein [Priestia megaterium]